MIPRNPCDTVEKPRAPRREIAALTPDQARLLLEAAKGDPLEALYLLAVTTGLRSGELLGLRWGDLDLDAGRLQVRRQLQDQGAGPEPNAQFRRARASASVETRPSPLVSAATMHGGGGPSPKPHTRRNMASLRAKTVPLPFMSILLS